MNGAFQMSWQELPGLLFVWVSNPTTSLIPASLQLQLLGTQLELAICVCDAVMPPEVHVTVLPNPPK